MHKSVRTIAHALALLLALSLVLAGCGGDSSSGGAPAGGASPATTQGASGEPVPLKVHLVAPVETAFFYPALVAQELGYFEEEGVDPEFVANDQTSGPAFIANDQVDIATPGVNEALFGAAEGIEFKVIYTPFPYNTDFLVTTDESIDSVEDLVGKLVGLGSTEQKAFLDAALAEAGIDPKQVRTVVIGEGGPAVADALKRHRVAAYTSPRNTIELVRASGLDLKDITPQTLARTPAVVAIASAETIQSKADAIKGFLRAWSKGTWAGQANPEAVAQLLRERVPEEWRDPKLGQALFDAARSLTRPVDDAVVGDVIAEDWENAQQRLTNAGELKSPIDVQSLIDPEFIEFANDFDRSEVEREIDGWAKENS